VPPQKTQKIDLSTEYPCPCRRRGALVPITLTEAFGCNRCQQIFVVEESGYVIEQLSTSYPYKKAWRWTGHRWNTANASLGESYLPCGVGNCLGTADFLATLGTEITNPTDYYYFLCVTRIAVGINPSANSLVSSQALASLWN
jgi:hypothetical protein